ncbi:MAG: DUF169 domain-containing protein [Actinomycetota bacterium]
MQHDYRAVASELESLLDLDVPPLAITFSDEAPDGVSTFDEPMSEPAEDGRRGRVSASCVFWMRGAERTFTTVPEDHGNCSIGRMTHGFAKLSDVAGNSDVAALFESGWVGMDDVPKIPVVARSYGHVTYGPLPETPVDPDIVFLRLTPKQLMILNDAVPEMSLEGKPQCHIIAMAKEHKVVAASIGCMLSRVRTEMGSHEMSCAIPGSSVQDVLGRLRRAESIDNTVATYAARDKQRFR